MAKPIVLKFCQDTTPPAMNFDLEAGCIPCQEKNYTTRCRLGESTLQKCRKLNTELEACGFTSAGNTFSTAGSDGGAFRLLTSPVGTDSGIVYVRMLASNTAATAAQYAGFSFFNGGSEELFLGKPFNAANYGFDVSGQANGAVLSSSPISSATTLLVYRLRFGALNDTIDLFVNPGSTLPGTPDATFTTADNTAFHATFDRIRLHPATMPRHLILTRSGLQPQLQRYCLFRSRAPRVYSSEALPS